MTHEDSMRCIELLGTEVMPAVREIGAELDLDGPFDSNPPVSINYDADASARVAAGAAAGS